jgi:hypothetical protein
MSADLKHSELRCFCARKPLLATYGIDENGRIYLHQKTFKQNRLYAESIIYSGEVMIHCRDCYRWHRITFDDPAQVPVLIENPTPRELSEPDTKPA